MQKEFEQAVSMKCQQIPAEVNISKMDISLGNISKMDFSKLQMRYVDGHEVGVYGTKKTRGGIMRWTMQ